MAQRRSTTRIGRWHHLWAAALVWALVIGLIGSPASADDPTQTTIFDGLSTQERNNYWAVPVQQPADYTSPSRAVPNPTEARPDNERAKKNPNGLGLRG